LCTTCSRLSGIGSLELGYFATTSRGTGNKTERAKLPTLTLWIYAGAESVSRKVDAQGTEQERI
jgi:hypothetical protein